MKVKLWIYIENLGDGSAAARFFSSNENAEEYASHDTERFCDDIYPVSFKNGLPELIDPIHWSEDQ